MKALRKTVSVLLSVLMMLSVFTSLPTVYAASSGTLGDDSITYSFDEDTGTLTVSGTGEMPDFTSEYSQPWKSYRNNMTKVVIGEGITRVGSMNFMNCYYISDLSLPSTLLSIGRKAFENIRDAQEIVIPDNVTTIGDSAFYSSNNSVIANGKTKKIVLGANVELIEAAAFKEMRHVTTVVFNDKLKTIGNSAFYNMQEVTAINLPESVETIEELAFGGNIYVKNVRIGNNVRVIGNNAFQGLTMLESAYISASVESMGSNIFAGIPKAFSITVASNNPYFCTDGRAIYNKDKTKLISFCGSGEYIIPETVTEIAQEAFYSSAVTKVVIPNSVTKISSKAFSYCSNLKTVIMGAGVQTVESEAFRGCENITAIAFPESTTSIGDSAFYGCLSLSSAMLVNDSVAIGSNAFTATASDLVIMGKSGSTAQSYAEANGYTFKVADLRYPNPTTLTGVAALDYNEIKISWNPAVGNCSGYVIVRSIDGINYSTLKVIEGDETSYIDNDVIINKLYYYKVAVVTLDNNLQLTSAYSEPASARTRLAVTEITDCKAASYNSAVVTWNEVRGADGYYIYTRLHNVDGTLSDYTLAKTVYHDEGTTATVTGLYTDMETDIQVAAFRYNDNNVAIKGDAGNTVTVRPLLDTIEFTSVEATAYNAISVRWNAVPGADGYRVEYSKNSDFSGSTIIDVASSLTSYTITGLDSFNTYYLRVRAVRKNPRGETVSQSSMRSEEPKLADIAKLDAERIGLIKVDLKWDPVDGADYYYIEVKESSDSAWTRVYEAPSTLHEYTVGEPWLLTDKNYLFRVIAARSNSGNIIVSSAPCQNTDVITTTFNSPVFSFAKMTSYNGVTMQWKKSVGATGYEIWRSIDDGAYEKIGIRSEEDEVNDTQTYFYNDVVTTGNKYSYKIRAYYQSKLDVGYANQYTQYSNVCTAYALEETPVISVKGVTYDTVTISWNATKNAEKYWIQWSTDAQADQNNTWQTYIEPCTGTEFTLEGKETNVTVYFRVYAQNGDSYSKRSAITSGAPKLKVPENVTCTVESYDNIRIEWDEVPGASGYEIMRKEANGSGDFKLVREVTNEVAKYNDTSVVTGIEYIYTVNAYRYISTNRRTGDSSAQVRVKPVLDPVIFVDSATGVVDYRTVRLSWNSVPGTEEYRIYRSINNGSFVLYDTVSKEKSSYEDTQAVTGSQNSYYVIAYRSEIATSKSETIDTYPQLTPAEIYTYEVTSSSSLRLKWAKIDGATSYDVYVATTSGNVFAESSKVGTANPSGTDVEAFNVTGLKTNTDYYFGIVANYKMDYYDNSTASIRSTAAYFARINLAAPTGRIAEDVSAEEIKLTWNKVDKIDGYKVYSVVDGVKTEVINIQSDAIPEENETVFAVIDNLEAGKGYDFTVCTYLKRADSQELAESESGEFAPVATKPEKVTLQMVETSDFNVVNLTYTQAVSSLDVEYVIQRKSNDDVDFNDIGTSTTLNFSDTNAETGKIYAYRVIPTVTYNGYTAYGDASNVIEAKTLLESPVISSITQADYNAAKLVWNSTNGADGYYIYRSLNNDEQSWSNIAKVEGNGTTEYIDRTLTCNVEYFFAVIPYRNSLIEGGEPYIGTQKNVASITTKLDKGTITSLTCTGYRSIKLTWKKVNGADGYRIYRSTNGKDFGMVHDTANGNTLTYSVNDLKCGLTYMYKICAYNYVGNKAVCGEQSDVKKVDVKPLNPKITSLKATSRTSVYFKWGKVDGAEKYYVYRSEKGNNTGFKKIATLDAKVLSYTDKNLTQGKTYYYTVRADHEGVLSGYNNGVKISMIPATPKVTAVSGTAYNKLKVTWSKVADCDGYVVYRSLKANGGFTKVATITNKNTVTYTNTVSDCGVTYYYTVKAYWKTTSATVAGLYNAGVAGHTVPTATKISKTQSAGYNAIKLTWTGIKEANGYRIYRTETKGKDWKLLTEITKGTTVTYTDKTAVTGKTYYYTVRSFVSVEGANIYGSYDKTGTAGKAIPATPKISSAKMTGARYITLTWNKIAGASGYKLYRSTKSTSGWTNIATIKNGSTVIYVDSAAIPGTQYYYTVRAYTTVNKANVYSDYVRTGTGAKTTLSTPKISTATAAGYNSITLKWGKQTGVDGYVIYRSTKSTSGWTKLKSVKGTLNTYTDTTAVYNTQYYYTIKSYVSVGGKNYYSGYATTGTAGKSAALVPDFSVASVGYNSVKLTWKSVGQADGYIIYRTTNSNNTGWKPITKLSGEKTTSYTDSTAECGTVYYYTMRSYKSINGKNVQSGYLKNGKRCKPVPSEPKATATRQQDNSVYVEWNEIDGADGYYVYRMKTTDTKWEKLAKLVDGELVYMDMTAEEAVDYVYTVKAYRVVNNKEVYSSYSKVNVTPYSE